MEKDLQRTKRSKNLATSRVRRMYVSEGLYETGEIICENNHVIPWQRITKHKDQFDRLVAVEFLEGHVQIEKNRSFHCPVCDVLVEFDEAIKK